MTIFDKMASLDRRWIYALIGLAVVVSLKIPFKIDVPITAEARNIYNFLDTLKAGDVIHLAMDYDPSVMAEVQPMTFGVLKQCFQKDIKVVVTALHQFGFELAASSLDTAVARHRAATGDQKVNGVDYVFLGYKPYPALIILGMGQNYRIPFPTDYYNVPLDSLPMMRGIKNYDDVKAVVNISGTSATDYWISYANGRYNVPLAIGVTGVMATDYYPYLQTGQLFGILGGVIGAAEYEKLTGTVGPAGEQVKVLVVTHLLIILFIVIGNIGYFMSRKRKRRAQT